MRSVYTLLLLGISTMGTLCVTHQSHISIRSHIQHLKIVFFLDNLISKKKSEWI